MCSASRISLLERLPEVRGKYRENADLSGTNWFRVGGPAEVLFRPADTEDLARFLKHKPEGVPVTVLGVGSNVIVRDGGIPGVVVRLGRGFVETAFGIQHSEFRAVRVGAGALCANVAKWCAAEGVAGLEFLVGVPGTIGGALRMNAGAYGAEVAQWLVETELVTVEGEIFRMEVDALQYGYRKCAGVPDGAIFTAAVFRGVLGEPE